MRVLSLKEGETQASRGRYHYEPYGIMAVFQRAEIGAS